MHRLYEKIDELTDFYIGVWEDICNIESPTDYKTGVDAVGDYLIKMAKERGFSVKLCEQQKAGNAFSITINAEADENPIVFSGHIDTVHPIGSFGTPPVKMDSEKIYGPGVMDCKGGVVASLFALDALSQCGFKKRPVKLIVQSDEETGSKTSDKKSIEFMLNESQNADAFLNTEGIQGNTAVLTRKGILRYKFTVCGKAMHSSKCTQGANAICESAHKIIELEKMKDINGLTCNCGVIQGGTTANSVAESCSFIADIRFANEEQYKEAVEICKQLANKTTIEGCTCQLEKVSERPAMQLTQRNERLLEKMNEIYKECGMPVLAPRGCLSGSDAAYITKAGIPCVDNLGVDGGNIHSVNEFAYLDSLAACAKRLAAVAYYI